MKAKLWKPEFVVVLVTLVILGCILLLRPIIGMANNGDFERMMTSAALQYATDDPDQKYFNYFISRFLVEGSVLTAMPSYLSSQVILVKLSAWISQWFTPGWFDIRFLAAVYMILLAVAFYLLVKSNRTESAWPQWTLAAMLVLVFADSGYTAYFNSLFGEPVSMIFLLLIAAFAIAISLKEKPSLWLLIGFYAAGIFVVGAKVQNAPVGLILLLLSLRMWRLNTDRAWRGTVVAGSLLLVASSIIIYLSIDKNIKVINQYQTVFYGILKDSPTPEEDLEELGLNPEWAVLAGTNYFVPDLPIDIKSPEFESELRDNISHSKIAMFYLKHPLRYWEKLQITAQNAFTIKPSYMGNYEQAEGKSPGALSHAYTLWSKFKVHVLPKSMLFILVFYAAFFLVWISGYLENKSNSKRIYLEVLLGIALIGIIQFIVPVIGDGEADLEKHLFLFNVCFDIMFVAAVVWVVHTIVERRKRFRALRTGP